MLVAASAVFLSSPHHKRFRLMGPCMQDSPVTFGFHVDCSRFENTTVGGDISPCLVAYDPDVEPVSFSIVNTVTYTGLVNVTSAGTRIDLRLKRFCFGLCSESQPLSCRPLHLARLSLCRHQASVQRHPIRKRKPLLCPFSFCFDFARKSNLYVLDIRGPGAAPVRIYAV